MVRARFKNGLWARFDGESRVVWSAIRPRFKSGLWSWHHRLRLVIVTPPYAVCSLEFQTMLEIFSEPIVIPFKNRFLIMIDWSVFKSQFFDPIIDFLSYMIDFFIFLWSIFLFFFLAGFHLTCTDKSQDLNCAIQTLRFICMCVGLWGP